MNQMIDRENWLKCKICGIEIVGGDNTYKSHNFKKHILQHNMDFKEYFEKICLIELPTCPCGICNKKTKFILRGSNYFISQYGCGRNNGVMKWSEKAKTERKGKGNPMFGKKAWNTGLTKDTSEILAINAKKLTGRIISDETKEKQSASAKIRIIHGHTGCEHSEQSKQKMRESTLKRIKNGDFKQNDTKPAMKMKEILDNLNISYEREYLLECWSFDFHIKDANIMIEVDGDYFHSNPKIYQKGPETKTQKINFYRDQKKNKFCEDNNIKIYRFWESDILSNTNKVIEEVKNACRKNSGC